MTPKTIIAIVTTNFDAADVFKEILKTEGLNVVVFDDLTGLNAGLIKPDKLIIHRKSLDHTTGDCDVLQFISKELGKQNAMIITGDVQSEAAKQLKNQGFTVIQTPIAKEEWGLVINTIKN